jgi:hypothetical protein
VCLFRQVDPHPSLHPSHRLYPPAPHIMLRIMLISKYGTLPRCPMTRHD